jgi:hypothetical protein
MPFTPSVEIGTASDGVDVGTSAAFTSDASIATKNPTIQTHTNAYHDEFHPVILLTGKSRTGQLYLIISEISVILTSHVKALSLLLDTSYTAYTDRHVSDCRFVYNQGSQVIHYQE